MFPLPSDFRLTSTGSLLLDRALSAGGGIASGEIVVISGPIASGKTVVCQHLVAAAQKLGRSCAWIDSDYTFDPTFAAVCGVDASRLILARPAAVFEALEMLEILVQSQAVELLIVDSATFFEDADADIRTVGEPHTRELQPTTNNLSLTLRRISPYLQRSGANIIFTRATMHSPEPVYHQLSRRLARLALELRTAVRIRLDQPRPIWRDGRECGQQVDALVNRVKAPHPRNSPFYARVVLDIMYHQGINLAGEVLDLGTELGLIQQKNGVFIFQHQVLGPSRVIASEALERLGMVAPLEKVIRRQLFGS